ncbi:hypothetical protein [Limnoglobus roseus]|nr:hypothetical protein [Limnoglobus roseus]
MAVLTGCSGNSTPIASPPIEKTVSIDTFLDEFNKRSESEKTALAKARRDISEMSKVDQPHELKLLARAQSADLTNLKATYKELSQVKGFGQNSPACRYFAMRVLEYTRKMPEFRELVRWGWENVLSKKDQKFDVIGDWINHLMGDVEHRAALPELVDSLKSGKKPSDDALNLYSAVFATERLPHGW